jgi:hypothetical protein
VKDKIAAGIILNRFLQIYNQKVNSSKEAENENENEEEEF